MNYKIVKELMKRYAQIREVVDLANDYNIECEECACLFVALVDVVLNSEDLKAVCFKKHYIDDMSFLAISLDANASPSTIHRWVEEYECRLATALSFVRGFDIWVDNTFPEIRPHTF